MRSWPLCICICQQSGAKPLQGSMLVDWNYWDRAVLTTTTERYDCYDYWNVDDVIEMVECAKNVLHVSNNVDEN